MGVARAGPEHPQVAPPGPARPARGGAGGARGDDRVAVRDPGEQRAAERQRQHRRDKAAHATRPSWPRRCRRCAAPGARGGAGPGTSAAPPSTVRCPGGAAAAAPPRWPTGTAARLRPRARPATGRRRHGSPSRPAAPGPAPPARSPTHPPSAGPRPGGAPPGSTRRRLGRASTRTAANAPRPGWRAFSKPMSRAGSLRRDFRREPAAQGANKPVLLGFAGSVNRRCGEADRAAHDSKQTVTYDRVIAWRNRRQCTGLVNDPIDESLQRAQVAASTREADELVIRR